MVTSYRLTARGLTYNNNSGQLSIEYLRPDPTGQFSKRALQPSSAASSHLRRVVAQQVRRETDRRLRQDCSSARHVTTAADQSRAAYCPNPKPSQLPDFTGSVDYVYNDVAKVSNATDTSNTNTS